ncbi:protein FAR1-RELATED SEQUENCE 5 [Arachis hypogaea]|uniref:protein FAR1-RELATED SEQUENCE 5 n=1 Tax=Arachis hypogaea TaxID=3818 RepID=UPI000DEC1D20|nr:protein FAR1-RELATED SEQUENCE 5 [Arachis hypogaea]QHO56116.1 Protein FAR1-RELATED SEQUENCE [Arachis hypogaea]
MFEAWSRTPSSHRSPSCRRSPSGSPSKVVGRMEEEDVASLVHGAPAMADEVSFVGNEEELVSDEPYVCVGDEPSSEASEDANMDGYCGYNDGDDFYESWEDRGIDGIADFGRINFKEISFDEMRLLHFPDRHVAFAFYNLYAKMNGFAARKTRLRQNAKKLATQQQFVCFRQGFREFAADKEAYERKREPKPETRCGCLAQMRVHLHLESGRWIISYFDNVHNHEMLDGTLTFMLPGHRKMNSTAIEQMNMMLRVGIKTPQIYSAFVHTAGGFQNVPFLKRDMYNQIDKQRKLIGGDAVSCLRWLESYAEENPGTFVRYLADKENRLVHLFWSDNCSQLDYHVFGDVVAFDATYRKNKYMCPLVVFSGVNHHNQTIIFAAALVANESEETYSWLLERFLEAMKGKAPACVITDGHAAMRKAIEKVFPMAYHRLCAWHLLRNATSHLANPAFTSEFKKCMLFDYEVSEFEARWERLVTELQLQDNQWVCDLYDRRKMWATAHIHGHFFGGFRTTSRCEGLHSMLGKFVHSRHNLRNFVEQYFRCVSEMRSREAQSDMHSVVGHLVLQSPLHDLERSAAKLLTREIFILFRPMLSRACTLKVRSCTLTPTSDIYTISRWGNSHNNWHVSHYPEDSIFKCSCLRMESLGIPCDHIVALLVHLDFTEIPTSLVLERWSKNARSKVRQYVEKGPFSWDSMVSCRNWMLNDLCREMCVLASVREDKFETMTEKIRSEINRLKHDTEAGPSTPAVVGQSSTLEGCVQNPLVVRRKKRPKRDSVNRTLVRGVRRCSICHRVGHNRTSCQSNVWQGQRQQPSHEEDVDEDNYYTLNFGEEVDDEYAHYHSQPVGQEEHFGRYEEEFQVPLTDPYYSWHE